MRHLRQIGHNRLSCDILAEQKRKRIFGPTALGPCRHTLPRLRFHDLAEHHRTRIRVRHLYPNRLLARYRREHTKRFRLERELQIAGERFDLVDSHAMPRLYSKLRDRRAFHRIGKSGDHAELLELLHEFATHRGNIVSGFGMLHGRIEKIDGRQFRICGESGLRRLAPFGADDRCGSGGFLDFPLYGLAQPFQLLTCFIRRFFNPAEVRHPPREQLADGFQSKRHAKRHRKQHQRNEERAEWSNRRLQPGRHEQFPNDSSGVAADVQTVKDIPYPRPFPRELEKSRCHNDRQRPTADTKRHIAVRYLIHIVWDRLEHLQSTEKHRERQKPYRQPEHFVPGVRKHVSGHSRKVFRRGRILAKRRHRLPIERCERNGRECRKRYEHDRSKFPEKPVLGRLDLNVAPRSLLFPQCRLRTSGTSLAAVLVGCARTLRLLCDRATPLLLCSLSHGFIISLTALCFAALSTFLRISGKNPLTVGEFRFGHAVLSNATAVG